MMKPTLAKKEDGTIEIICTIASSDIKKAYEDVVEEYVKQAEVDGFRKGKAPRSIVEPKLDKTKVYEEVVKHVVPAVYTTAIHELDVKPILHPKIELIEAKEGEDWKIRATTCEKPLVELKNYKEKIRDLVAAKAKKIWLPGQKQEKEEEKDKKPTLDEILSALFDEVTVVMSSVLIDHEVNRLLSELIEQTQKLGITVDQYLSSTHKTSESIREEYTKQAIKTLSLEFALEAIADQEHIAIEDSDIEKAIQSAKTQEEKDALAKEKYYLATILRRQKVLDYLASV